MSLLSKDISLILNLLNEDTCGSLLTFEQISIQFQHGVSKSDYLSIGNCFVFLSRWCSEGATGRRAILSGRRATWLLRFRHLFSQSS